MDMPDSESPVFSRVDPETVRGILGGVIDPELRAPITDLGMVGEIKVDGSAVAVQIVLTTLGCPLRAQIKKEVVSKVASVPGVEEVTIDWIEMTPE